MTNTRKLYQICIKLVTVFEMPFKWQVIRKFLSLLVEEAEMLIFMVNSNCTLIWSLKASPQIAFSGSGVGAQKSQHCLALHGSETQQHSLSFFHTLGKNPAATTTKNPKPPPNLGGKPILCSYLREGSDGLLHTRACRELEVPTGCSLAAPGTARAEGWDRGLPCSFWSQF